MSTIAQNPASPIQYLKGVGPHKAALLARLGISTLEDALFFLPVRYEDRRSMSKIVSLLPETTQAVIGKVVTAEVISPSRKNPGLKIFQVVITDGTGVLKGKWFNQAFLRRVFKSGQTVVFYGNVKRDFYGAGLEIMNPEYELIDDGKNAPLENGTDKVHTGRIVPVYRLTQGLSQRQMRAILFAALNACSQMIEELLSQDMLDRYQLPARRDAVMAVHFPPPSASIDDLNRGSTPYHQRLSFEELLMFQLGVATLRKRQMTERGITLNASGSLAGRLEQLLPFTLTAAQRRVISEIRNDMRSSAPMHRLVQGDVGSGKTLVALISMLDAVEAGYQAALMAPTEILAEQHYLNIHKLVEPLGLSVALQTSSTKNRFLNDITTGTVDLIVGTHALIQEGVAFHRLGLIVIDEQHRFGVMQRAELRKKGHMPDTLVMTATPIPRTLALTLYGDLDYSVIDELPPNRSPIITKLLGEKQKDRIYQDIDSALRKGKQVYVVYPVIEESEKTSLNDAQTGAELLREKFPERKVSLIHGRLKPAERDAVMNDFKERRIDILACTTVIEVGVDVPNATLMIIFHAERFGFAQLHQLRGRVGRGSDQSHCILLAYGHGDDARRRLSVMVETTDGFRIAEEDLALRGPGEFFGTKQSGLPDLRIANIARDAKIVETSRKEAFNLLERDAGLATAPRLRVATERFWGERIEFFTTA
ncbi:MAG TPA: ATP-dependent DNA helicase RecG [Dissulfurispiraceae bacterium]|nr:ATP-dependent DNA helicase RecG [Dissulfurispiraceae bacterium]